VRGRTAKNSCDWRSAAAIIRRYQQPGDGIGASHPVTEEPAEALT
jgi:hypothetical protein